MGKDMKELELHFLRCTTPDDAFQMKRTLKRVGFSSTFTFVDSTGNMKLTAKLVFKNMKILQKTKELPAFIRFRKVSTKR